MPPTADGDADALLDISIVTEEASFTYDGLRGDAGGSADGQKGSSNLDSVLNSIRCSHFFHQDTGSSDELIACTFCLLRIPPQITDLLCWVQRSTLPTL